MYNVDDNLIDFINDLDDFLQKRENIEKYSIIPTYDKYYKDNHNNSFIISAVKLNKAYLGFIIIFEKNKNINQYEKLIIENASYLYAVELLKQKETLKLNKI